ncbi:ABC transporter substrate-binding protein [Nesterenkonia populi]|uniref:ABC transporter substrate-binding protein n=1 Tax=Nesterenkonia populi TaxID=1591087 RepID=UPI0011BDEDAC|nr:ABC transporter substrate-binding protein [Nesterenkonia populi]
MRYKTLVSASATFAATVLTLAACGGDAESAADYEGPYEDLVSSDECEQLREDNPDLVGETRTNALNPHVPGYATVSDDNPNEYEGFDIDLGEAVGACLGFEVDYLSVGFSELIPTVDSGQADWILSNLYATEERAEGGVDFISYSHVYDGILVGDGNPEDITGIDTSLCGTTVALNRGYVEVPLVEAVGPDCEEIGEPAPELLLFDAAADCVQAVRSGQADSYMNDVNTVNRFIAEHPDELDSAETVMLDYEIAIGVPQGEHDFRDAVQEALMVIQENGLQEELAERWELDANHVAEPNILSVG